MKKGIKGLPQPGQAGTIDIKGLRINACAILAEMMDDC